MRISIVVAVDWDGVIGDSSGIPWHLPSDLERFKALTWGKPIIMGRTTHEHIGRALPGRLNIVLSRRPGYLAAGCQVASSFPGGLAIARESGAAEAMVIGGEEVYREALFLANQVFITLVDGCFNTKAWFGGTAKFDRRKLKWPDWEVVSEEVTQAEERNPYRTIFRHYRRIYERKIRFNLPRYCPSSSPPSSP